MEFNPEINANIVSKLTNPQIETLAKRDAFLAEIENSIKIDNINDEMIITVLNTSKDDFELEFSSYRAVDDFTMRYSINSEVTTLKNNISSFSDTFNQIKMELFNINQNSIIEAISYHYDGISTNQEFVNINGVQPPYGIPKFIALNNPVLNSNMKLAS